MTAASIPPSAGCDASFLGEVGKRGFTNDEETGSGGDGYLDDEDIFHTREGVLSRFGSSTLQARLAQQRRKERERRNQLDVEAKAAVERALGRHEIEDLEADLIEHLPKLGRGTS